MNKKQLSAQNKYMYIYTYEQKKIVSSKKSNSNILGFNFETDIYIRSLFFTLLYQEIIIILQNIQGSEIIWIRFKPVDFPSS